MFTTGIARSGDLTLFINGRCIHSKYNPKAEADTFIKKQTFTIRPERIILIGSGLGYLKYSILKLYPSAKILSIHLDKYIYDYAYKTGDSWVYGEETSLSSKLASFIPDFLISYSNLLKWFPCTECFPNRTKEIEKVIQQFFLERRGTIFTTGNFGRQWLKNAYYNYSNNRKLSAIKNIDSPVLIAASGSSLNSSMNIMRNYKNKFILVALPSSLSALNDANIRPDFILHTDPGYWAREHLKHIKDTEIPIIMPLTSSFKSSLRNPVIYINQGTNIENAVLDQRFIKIQPHGTVAGTAYLFFRKITDSPIIFLGLDFCFDDVKEHISPHSFDVLYYKNQDRFNSHLNFLYKKQQEVLVSNKDYKTTKAFLTYSGWFNDESRLTNAYRYRPTGITTKGLKDIDSKQICSLLDNSSKVFKIDPIQNKEKNVLKRKNFTNLLEHIITLLENFYININTIDSDGILNLFTSSNLLLEVLQYTVYLEILELSHYYKTDIERSRNILNNIYIKSVDFISELLTRINYD